MGHHTGKCENECRRDGDRSHNFQHFCYGFKTAFTRADQQREPVDSTFGTWSEDLKWRM